MRIHALQHVAFEGLGSIEDWAAANQAPIRRSLLFAGEALPSLDSFDCLVVMGGPMNIYEDEIYPWLRAEKDLIKEAIEGGKIVLGICLGAQLIADALGAKVVRNTYREIGWFPVTGIHPALRDLLPENALVMHWHGDTFNIPPAAEALASSAACPNQGFIYRQHVIALQFHLETTPASLASLIEHGQDDLAPGGPYIQTPEEMQTDPSRFLAINRMMATLLSRLQAVAMRG